MIQVRDRPDARWDERVGYVPEGNYYQSTVFATYYRCLADLRPWYLTVRDGSDALLGQLLLLEGRSGGARIAGLPGFARPVARALLLTRKRFFLFASGPLVFVDGDRRSIHTALLTAARGLSDGRGARSLSGYPSIYGRGPETEATEFTTAAGAAGLRVDSLATFVLDLDRPESELWAGLRSEARTKVRRAERDDVVVRVCETEDDYARFVAISRETGARAGIADPHRERRWRCFWTITRPRGLSTFFLSEQGGLPLSAQHAVVVNGVVLLSGVSYTDVARERRLYGNDLMQWRIIQWARGLGARRLDWGGAASSEQADTGIDDFKAKWGGRRMIFPVVSSGEPVDAALTARANT